MTSTRICWALMPVAAIFSARISCSLAVYLMKVLMALVIRSFSDSRKLWPIS